MHHHEFWWRFFPKKELTQIYLSSFIRSFALSLISLFIPLYLHIEIGYTLHETLYFFVFYAVMFAIFTPIAAKFAARFGLKHSILLSVPFYLLFILLLYLLPYYSIHSIFISSLFGISQAFYWMGMHMVFHHASDHKHRGEEVGKRASFSILAGLFGPLLGGFLVATFGFKIVFCLAAISLFLSAIVLFNSKEGHSPYHFSVRSVLNKDHWKDSLFFVSKGTMVMASGVLWPLFIFLILQSYLSLGIVGSIISGTSALLLWLVGRYSDHIKKRLIIKLSTPIEALSWFLKSIVIVKWQVFAMTIFGALSHGIRESPLGALEYDKARGEIAAYFVSREVFICLGRILLLMFVIMTNSLSGGLMFQGFASFVALLF
jgi:MFS family permease